MNPHDFFDAYMRFSVLLPDFDACLDSMARRSAEVGARLSLSKVATGAHVRQWVEYGPGSGSGPLVPVFIHGGYWRALRAEDHRFVLESLGRLGESVANVEYRLMPHTRLAGLVEDVCAGLEAIVGAVPGARLLPVGHSAGGHLALAAARAAPHLPLAGVVAVSGVYDLAPVPYCFVQEEIHLTADEVAAFTLPPPAASLNVLFVTGDDETVEFQRQTAMMAAGSGSPWHRVRGTHHLTVLNSLADPSNDPALWAKIEALVA